MTERSRAQIIGLFCLVGIFLLKDLVIPSNEETSSNNPSKEIPSLHLERFSGPEMKFVFW